MLQQIIKKRQRPKNLLMGAHEQPQTERTLGMKNLLMGAHEQLPNGATYRTKNLLMGAHEQQISKLIYVFNDNELKLRKDRNNPKISRNDTERKHTLSAGFRSSRSGRR
jgi:hypothetical protein